MGLFGFFDRKQNVEKLDKGLEKTKKGFFSKLRNLVSSKSKIDEDVLDELEEILITSDVGVETTIEIIDRIRERVSNDKYSNSSELDFLLKDEITKLVLENYDDSVIDFEIPKIEEDGKKMPYVVLVVGVNGVGKTTTIGKLSYQYKQKGYKVLLGAADTFRAAAVDQLKRWGERVGVDIIEKGMNTDPAAVAFEAVEKGVEGNYDIVIIDTAGRLHNKVHLMNELSKIKRVTQKNVKSAPHDVLLVLDASTGQNAINQATEFTKATQVSALALTKLDGTAKGGVVIGVSNQFKIPVKFIGVGEGIDDLQVFNPKIFVDSLFQKIED